MLEVVSRQMKVKITKYMQLMRDMFSKHLPSKTVLIIILVSIGTFLIPLPHNSQDSPNDIQGGIVWPASGETELTLDYDVWCNSTQWWYNQVVQINISLDAIADVSEIGRIYNLSYVLIALNVEGLGRFFLVEENLNGTEGVFTNTSIDGTFETFEYEKSYDIELSELSPLKALGPKIFANLDILLEIDWHGHGSFDETTTLSNFRGGSILNWNPTLFPIILDNPHYRISGILIFWLVLLTPIPIYILAALWKRNQGLNIFFKRYSFWFITGLAGIYVTLIMAVTIGPFVPSGYYPPFSAAVTLLIGIPIAFLVTGLRKAYSEPFPFLNQYAKYVNFCTLTGVKCRTKKELSDSHLSWNPHQIDLLQYDFATSRFLMFILFAESVLIFGGSIVHPPSLFLQQFGALLIGCTLFALLIGERADKVIGSKYWNWDLEWFNVWTLVHDQIITEEHVFEKLKLLEKLKDENDDDTDDIELLCKVLGVSTNSIPNPVVQTRSESITIGLLTWYTREQLTPRVEKLTGEVQQVLSNLLEPFGEKGMPWKHPLGRNLLMRRVIFVSDALLIPTKEIVVDLAALVLGSAVTQTISDNVVRSEVFSIYKKSADNPRLPMLHTTSAIKSLLPLWSIFYLVVGIFLSEILLHFI